MTVIDTRLLSDCLKLLESFAAQHTPPARAREEFAEFRRRRATVDLTLAWETEEVDGSTTYDVLIRTAVGTVSMTLAPHTQLPWPLRGVSRRSEADLLKLGSTRLTVADALVALDFLWERTDLLRRLIDTCVVQEEILEHPVEVDDEAVQACSEAFRRGKGLYTGVDTHDWLAARGLTQTEFTQQMHRLAVMRELRRRLGSDVSRTWFEDHRELMDTLTVAWVAMDSAEQGPDAAADPVDMTDADFLQAVAEAVRRSKPAGISRWRVLDGPPELADARPGQRCSLTVQGHPAIVDVLARDHATFDADTRAALEDHLFRQWLDERRAGTEIEWFWGTTERTAVAR